MSAPVKKCEVTPLEALRRLYDVARKVDASESGEFETLLQGELAVAESVLRDTVSMEAVGFVSETAVRQLSRGFTATIFPTCNDSDGERIGLYVAPVVPVAAQPVVQQEPIGTLSRNADESLTFTPLRDFHVRDGMFLFSAPSLEAQPAGEVAQLEQVREAVLLYFDALTARQHGGVAQDKAFSKIQDALGLYWQFGVDHRAMAQGEKHEQ